MKREALRKAVSQQVSALNIMGLQELRMQWEGRFGAPPKHRAPDLLRRILAWRIQADALGGLDAQTVRLLSNESKPLMAAQAAGTRLARDYAGRRHEVVVAEDGVIYDGNRYRSLSEVARMITGQRWNGPRFFGLRRENVR